jgi:CheY-like chemotaxis protein
VKRILIVEDNIQNLELAAVILELDYEILEAENGEVGVQTAKAELPDLILMDLSMPVMNGWDAFKAIRADPETAHIPVVAFTAHALRTDREAVVAAGFDGYVTKPVDASALLECVEHLLKESGGTTDG